MQMTAYSKVAAALRDQILAGDRQGGDRLPTERELCEQFHTSRITVRHALQILEKERLVERRQGAGTFVSANPVRKIPILSTDFFGSIEAHAPEMERHVESWGTNAASHDIAEQLQLLPNTPVRSAVRVDSLRGEVVAMDKVYLVMRFTGALDEQDMAAVDFVSRWEKVQRITLDYCSQTIEAGRAPRAVARLLGVREGTPVLKETNVTYVPGGLPAGLFVTYYRSDIFRFEATVQFKARHHGTRQG